MRLEQGDRVTWASSESEPLVGVVVSGPDAAGFVLVERHGYTASLHESQLTRVRGLHGVRITGQCGGCG